MASLRVTPKHPALARNADAFSPPEVSELSHHSTDADSAEHQVRMVVSCKHKKHGYTVSRTVCAHGLSKDQAEAVKKAFGEEDADHAPDVHTHSSGLLVTPELLVTRPAESAAALNAYPLEGLKAVSLDTAPELVEDTGVYVATRFIEREPITVQLIKIGHLEPRTQVEFLGTIMERKDVQKISVVVQDEEGQRRSAGINETLPPPPQDDTEPHKESKVPEQLKPLIVFLEKQDKEGVEFMAKHLDGFAEAWKDSRVGHHMMVAGETPRDAEAAFVCSMLRFRDLGFRFVLVEASNPWTASCCEKFGCTAIQLEAFADHPVGESVVGPPDSGCVLYVMDLTQAQ